MSPARPHHLGRRISALADGTLTGQARDLLLAHVAHCSACRAALDAERVTRAMLDDLPAPALPPDLVRRLQDIGAPGDPLSHRRAAMPHGVEQRAASVPSPRTSTRVARSPASRRALVGVTGAAVTLVAFTSTAYAVAGPPPETGPVVRPSAEIRASEYASTAAGVPLAQPALDGVPGSGVPESAPLVSSETAPTVVSAGLGGASAGTVVASDGAGVLASAVEAAFSVAYAGTRLVTRSTADGVTRRVVEVLHLPGHGTAYVEQAANDESGRAGFVPENEATSVDLSLLRKHYDVRATGRDVVAGRGTTALAVERAGGVVAARLWVDDATGLVLRQELLASDGSRESSTTFLDITTGERVEGSVHLPPQGATALRSLGRKAQASLTKEGWACPDSLPGGFDLIDVRPSESGTAPGWQLTYSDGLSTLSVFEQSGRLAGQDDSGWSIERWDGRNVRVRDGMPDQVVWSGDGVVWTVVADAPRDRVQAAVAALPASDGTEAGLARIGRGATRLASWANPFA